MEDTLRDPASMRIVNIYVLILVLMEDTLREVRVEDPKNY